LYGVRNSEVIDGTAWHHFSNKKQVFALTSNFQGLITPFGLLEIYTLDLPSDITFAEVTDAISNLTIYDEALLICDFCNKTGLPVQQDNKKHLLETGHVVRYTAISRNSDTKRVEIPAATVNTNVEK